MKKLFHISLLFILAVTISATTINIPADYPTIQEGIDASVDGDMVLVAQGTYYENLILEKEIVLASHAIYDDLGSDWLNNENITGTIISGAEEPIDPNKGSCLIIRDGDIQPEIIGLTFQDGDGTSMLVENCGIVEQDISVRSGGGILIYKAYPTIMYNRFINNGHDNDNVRAGGGGRKGGAIGHYSDDGIEFDEDRSFSSQNDNQDNNPTRDIPETLNIQNNYFENNASGDGANFYSHGYDGSIDVSNSIFEDIDCETNSVNDFVLRSIEDEANYVQNDISGNCIESSSFYVSSTGNDSNDGTESDPFKTIGRALTLVKPYLGLAGETVTTINLASGTYSPTTTGEKFPIVLPDNVRLIGEGRETTILDAEADEENQAAVMIIKEVENVRVANLTLTGGFSESHGCKGGGGLLITANDDWNFGGPITSTDVEIENVIIRNNISFKGGGLSLIRVSGFDLNNIIIEQNNTTINHATYENEGGGLYAGGSVGSMTNISFTANDVHMGGTAVYLQNSTITMIRCHIADNFSEEAFSTVIVDGGSLHLINSNIVDNTNGFGSGIVSCNNGHFNIVNSIIYDNCSTYIIGEGDWDCDEPYGPSNVLIWPGGQGYEPGTGEVSYSDVMGGWSGSGNINIDPRFLAPASGDYTLSSASPCIDAGTADLNGDGMEDIDYVGDAPDMGAFEFGGILGCTDPEAENFDPDANMDDGSCEYLSTSEISVSYNTGWNMVGLPLEVEDAHYQTLFPDAYNNAMYSFDGSYSPVEYLIQGEGYLVRLSDGGIVEFSGATIDELTLSLTEGWNLISGISTSLPVDVLYNSGLVVSNGIYAFDGSYYQASAIDPGMGYWVRALADGDVTLSSSSSMGRTVPIVNHFSDANTLELSNGTHSTTLYFGKDVPEGEALSYSLPPIFPQMDFDARFTDNMRYAKDLGEISVINTNKDLTLNYTVNIHPGDYMEWVLITNSGEEYILTGTDEIVLNQGTTVMTLTKRAILPQEYTLHQNYPNPFNPVTSLSYNLPEQAQVTLIVYDLMGRKITQLINTIQEAGYKSVQWNATDTFGKPVSAGVYLYQIRAGEFVQTKKMVLLK
jgi:hypothetical protein